MGRGEKGREFHGGTRWVSRVPSLTSSAPPHFDVYFCFFFLVSRFFRWRRGQQKTSSGRVWNFREQRRIFTLVVILCELPPPRVVSPVLHIHQAN
ncbi:hypothetical protein CGCSCA4_v011744 [Colletotrichum siamense]|uniref:Uncharacterized protein n=1 Tax=Colletotrichum siamense TaxID=690259 RepID=A0A9P5BM43_COLSI|nr:hypothetical protein CGCSCA4_v011744 [Colletotrichum siamense]KAF4843791.1 hypothetical protein CGCSCA2_v014179 [Colletotrichum siamense]